MYRFGNKRRHIPAHFCYLPHQCGGNGTNHGTRWQKDGCQRRCHCAVHAGHLHFIVQICFRLSGHGSISKHPHPEPHRQPDCQTPEPLRPLRGPPLQCGSVQRVHQRKTSALCRGGHQCRPISASARPADCSKTSRCPLVRGSKEPG